MTIYDDLREQYAQWTQEDLDYWRSSGRFAEHFATGFKEYIGAPEHYRDPATGDRLPYVQLCALEDDHSAPGGTRFRPTKFHDALTAGDDGYLTFGVSAILERAQNAFPKTSFNFSIGMLPRAAGWCRMRIAGESLEIDMADDQARAPAYDHMLKTLQRWLASRPWDEQKNPIGFLHHPIE